LALSSTDRELIDGLLIGDREAWPAFVDRFLGLVSHVVNHAADCRGVQLTSSDREDLVSDVFVAVLDRDMAVLRRFQRRSSLATYLAVIARRVVVRKLMQRAGQDPGAGAPPDALNNQPAGDPPVEQRVADQDQVTEMLGGLPENEARVVRMFHLEGHSYHEISRRTGVPENTIGPVLSRARSRMRKIAGPN
jgi:RNA polymerase sigma-70 factor (ECF subfamily)